MRRVPDPDAVTLPRHTRQRRRGPRRPPTQLKNDVGGDLITITTADGQLAASELRRSYDVAPVVTDGTVSFQVPAGEAFLPGFVRSFDQPLDAINLRRPTLDDVFLELTGREIRDSADQVMAGGKR